MKANELMIGDWAVLVNPDGHRCIPQKITVDGLMLVIGATEGNYQYEPIPLTEDILKANDKMWFGKELVVVSMLINGMAYAGRINYVHELQHALRLCGLTELADNFKLT